MTIEEKRAEFLRRLEIAYDRASWDTETRTLKDTVAAAEDWVLEVLDEVTDVLGEPLEFYVLHQHTYDQECAAATSPPCEIAALRARIKGQGA